MMGICVEQKLVELGVAAAQSASFLNAPVAEWTCPVSASPLILDTGKLTLVASGAMKFEITELRVLEGVVYDQGTPNSTLSFVFDDTRCHWTLSYPTFSPSTIERIFNDLRGIARIGAITRSYKEWLLKPMAGIVTLNVVALKPHSLTLCPYPAVCNLNRPCVCLPI